MMQRIDREILELDFMKKDSPPVYC